MQVQYHFVLLVMRFPSWKEMEMNMTEARCGFGYGFDFDFDSGDDIARLVHLGDGWNLQQSFIQLVL